MTIQFLDMDFLKNSLTESGEDFIDQCEREYLAEVDAIAASLVENKKERPVVLLCGPSGSGKTTTAARLAQALEKRGCPARFLSMDNYFLPIPSPNIPLTPEGEIDYESPYRLDIPLFSRQMQEIFECKPVNVPDYDFPTQTRKPGFRFQRAPEEFVIFEGIHALNPAVAGTADFASRVYISVRTRLRTQAGDCLHPSLIRLMRRLLRDSLYRGRNFEQTIAMLPAVTAGEENHIIPFKRMADYELDSFIPYEAALYASFLSAENLPQEGAAGRVSREMLRFLQALPAVPPEKTPADSLLREFIGPAGQ